MFSRSIDFEIKNDPTKLVLRLIIDKIIYNGYGPDLLKFLKRKMRKTYWEKIRHVMIERIRRKKIIDGLKEIEEKKRQYLRTKRLHSLSNLFKNFLKKEHPELIVKGKIKKNIRNQLHPTLEELLDSY